MAALTTCLALAALGLPDTAHAVVVVDRATHHRFGFEPSPAYAAAHRARGRATRGVAPFAHALTLASPVCSNECLPLTYNGGPVQHAQHEYAIFWAPPGFAFPASYVSGVQQWFADVAAGNYSPGNVFGVSQQYYDQATAGGPQTFTPYDVSFAGSTIDTNPFPTSGCTDGTTSVCLTDAQIEAEIADVVTANQLPQDGNTEYFLFTPPNVGSCYAQTGAEPVSGCAYNPFCAYHSFMTGTAGSGSQIVYADMPWLYGTSCDANKANGLGYLHGDYVDPEVSTVSHEMSETMTNPDLNAWYDSQGQEIGDKCANLWGSGGKYSKAGLSTYGGAYYNQVINGQHYLLQLEFSNRDGGCMSSDTDAQPAVNVGVVPYPPVVGSPVQLTANTNDAYGVNDVTWLFADGSTQVGNPLNFASYSSGPSTVVVTDGHGNERQVAAAPTPTSATLASSVNPSGISQQVSLTATVSPAPDAGSVNFSDGGTSIPGCEAVSVDPSSGTATCPVVYASPGSHMLQASYSGDSSFLGGQSPTLTQVAQYPPPTVTAGEASGVTTGAATVSGTVDPNGQDTTYYFQWGPSTSYGQTTASVDAGSGSATVAASTNLSGLSAGTTYHVQLVAINATGTTYGPDTTFTTLQPPTISSVQASGVTSGAATVSGMVDPNGQDTTYYFQSGPSTSYGQTTASVDAGSGSAAVAASTNLSGLSAGTTYHVQLVAINATGTTYGPDITLTTLQPPSATTGQPSSVTPTSAGLSGTVNAQGQNTKFYFEYGPTTAYGQSTPVQTVSATSTTVNATAAIASLASNSTYHAQLVATSAAGTSYGGDVIFSTPSAPPYAPTVLADGPVSYWRLDEASGTRAADQQQRNSGTYLGRYTLGVTGAIAGNSGVSLNGSSGYVSVPDSTSLHTGDTFTAEAWVKLTALRLTQGIVGKGTYAVFVNSSNRPVLYLNNVGQIAMATAAINDTTHWHYIVVTKAGAAVHIYLDGADVTGRVTNHTITNSTVALRMGSAVGWLNGAVDEVAIYAKALTAAQVHGHYAAAGAH